jgi:hypothetical protein
MAAKYERLTKAELERKISANEEKLLVCLRAEQSVNDLVRLSQGGDKLASLLLSRLTVQMIDARDSIVKTRPELGRWLARQLGGFSWPALIYRKRALRRGNDRLMDTLQLGKGGILSDREWHPDAPSTRGALMVLAAGYQRRAAGLGGLRLTQKNKKDWFDKNWKWLFDGEFKPEQSDLLRRLGEFKAKKKPKYCKHLRPATQLANLRAEIKARVWQAFDQIVRPEK